MLIARPAGRRYTPVGSQREVRVDRESPQTADRSVRFEATLAISVILPSDTLQANGESVQVQGSTAPRTDI